MIRPRDLYAVIRDWLNPDRYVCRLSRDLGTEDEPCNSCPYAGCSGCAWQGGTA